MGSLIPLIQNETIKIWKKKRFFVIVLIVLVLVPVFTYAQLKISENNKKEFGTQDWRKEATQKISDITNRLASGRVPEEWKKWLRVEAQQLQYYLDKDINPSSPDGVSFTREFMSNAAQLFLPLLVTVVASDLVSGEHSTGTIKLLLTRPVRRWRILTGKLAALTLYVSLTVLVSAALSYGISGAVFGYHGWEHPVLVGFQIHGSDVDYSHVHSISQWQYVLMELGLVWFACMCVACMSLMISVLVRSTAAGMGIMMATIIAGTILVNMVSSWESAKYLFMVNLGLTTYLAGDLPPIDGMTLGFSVTVLTVWTAVSLIVSYGVFTKQDILN